MKDRKEDLTVENGSTKGPLENHRVIWRYIEELFDFEYRAKIHPDWTPTHNDERVELWKNLKLIDCSSFYMKDGAKITRPIKGLLEAQFGKMFVKLNFAEFCKRVGNLYAEVKATAHLRNTYFDNQVTGVENFGDDGSCFRPGGQNQNHGKLIDRSPCTGVITITPADGRFAAGRIIVWFKTPSIAHLINKYSKSGARELPHSIYVRALEKLTDTELTFRRESEETCNTLDIYINNEPVICNVAGKNDFSSVIKSFKLACSQCGSLHSSAGNRTPYCDDCSEGDDHVHCHICGGEVSDDERWSYGDDYYCESCYHDHFFYCGSCSEDCPHDGSVSVRDERGRRAGNVCGDCAENHYTECHHCGEMFPNDSVYSTGDGDMYCSQCAETQTFVCDECEEHIAGEPDEDGRCEDCHEESEEKAS